MRGLDLIKTGKKLLENNPTESDCSRAISTAYYALFSGLCEVTSKALVNNEEFKRANYQVFRSLDHKNVCSRCIETRDNNRSFPDKIKQFADTFIELNEQRENADYCPNCTFTALEANDYLEQAEEALKGLHQECDEHCRAFAIYVLLKPNNRNQMKKKISSD